jgi:DNA-directed RNA polymerase specialized sigma24 family protein
MKVETTEYNGKTFTDPFSAKLLSDFERVISRDFRKVYLQKLAQLPSEVSHLTVTFEIINLSVYHQERGGSLSPEDVRGLALVLTRTLEYRNYLSKIVSLNLPRETSLDVIQDLASEIKVKLFKECLRMIVEGRYLYHKASSEAFPSGLESQALSLNSFIYRVAKNCCIDYLRRQRLERDFLVKLPELSGSKDHSEDRTLAMEDLSNNTDYEANYVNRLTLDEAERLLPAQLREFFQFLRCGYQPGEIQKLLNLSDINFKIIRRKILRLVRTRLLKRRPQYHHLAAAPSLPRSDTV